MSDNEQEPSLLFSWAKGKVLTKEDFDIEAKVAYIENFIFSGSLTLIYSPPKQGKTWLGYGIAKQLGKMKSITSIYYLDMDNSIFTLKERKIDETLINCEKIHYITRGTIGCEPLAFLGTIAHKCVRDAYNDVVFFLDTTKDFVNTDNKLQSSQFMNYCVRLRDAGATLIVLHHATKNKKTISGSTDFLNTPDNVYEMKQISKKRTILNYSLRVTHARGSVKDCKWSVDTQNLELKAYDAVAVGLSEDELLAVESALFVLKNSPEGLSGSQLIKSMGYDRSNRTGKRLVKELIGKYWRLEEKSVNNHVYHLIKEKKKDDKKTTSL